jgi:3'-phosphoadenosine 5'-phosphosulfate sulfotransferase (PAPS reductase)/FAD synthetase
MNAGALVHEDPLLLEVDAPEEIVRAAADGAVFVFNISGGKDGLCAADAANRFLDRIGHPRSLRHAMHADLGRAEWRETPRTVEEQAAFLDLPLIIVRRERGDLVSVWEQRYQDGLPDYRSLKQVRLRGPWSGPGQKFCQPAMKRDQFVKTLRHAFPTQTVVCVIGVRRDESRDRAKAKTLSIETRLSTPGRTRGLNWNAIAHWSTADVFAYAKARGLPMHEAYGVWGSSRLSCALCVFASKGDIQASLSNVHNHDLLHALVDIENRTGFSFQRGAWLADARPDVLSGEQLLASAAAKSYSLERNALESIVKEDFLAGSDADPWPRRLPDADEAVAIAEARRLVGSWTGLDLEYRTASAVIDRMAGLREAAASLRR